MFSLKDFKMPSAYTILITLIIVVALLTWIVPAGKYQQQNGKPVPETYHQVEQNPQGIFEIIMAPVRGFHDAIGVSFFILVIGGYLGIVMETGAIDSGIAHITRALKGKEKWMIPILMIAFGLGGTSFGMCEETIAFYPLVIPVFLAAGYDVVTAVSVILLGAGVGCLGSTVNPFATGIASGFAKVSIGEGIGLRLLILVVLEAIAIYYVMKYADKVKKDPSKSIVYDLRERNRKHFLHSESQDENEFPELTGKRKLILGLFSISFLVMIFGVIPFEDIGITFLPTLGWWFKELTALFFVSALVVGLAGGLSEGEIVSSFIEGARDLLGVAFIVGISRGITVVMDHGHISATFLHWGESTLSQLGEIPFIIFTYLFYIPLSFLVPSTSGLATLSMPIMAPIGEFAGVGRELVVTIYQSSVGIVNLFTPTSGVVMGALAIAKLPYDRWIKHVWKLVGILIVANIILLSIGTI
ncbi:YfcC family protein [Sporohalobacter salinus]|uniref:YfcC family protein n=1 Tax=Sporohalobacter salinus TaxID=1494606 RepID=UPI0019601982|nr:YfcC family protein [Sporohalobacter salinus]MBM7622679.1 putative ion transporter superfamily protein YfcC [Sporohalobacter salinus]